MDMRMRIMINILALMGKIPIKNIRVLGQK